MDITIPTTSGASPAPTNTTTDKKLSFQLLGKLWKEKKRKDAANASASASTSSPLSTSTSSTSSSSSTSSTSSSSSTSSTSSAPAPAPVVSGAKKVWAEQRAAAAAKPPTNPLTPPESRPIATPTTRQLSDTTSHISDEGDPMDWDEIDEEMMDTRDDYPGWGNVGSCQAAWMYEMIILPSMIAAGMPLIPSPPYAYPFVR